MGDKQDKNIYIYNIIGGGPSGELLKGCYFIRQGNTYTFFDKHGEEKAGDIRGGKPFSFPMDGLNWTLDITNPVGPDKLSGTWNDNIDPGLADGSYQAEAGGTGEEGDANAASAGGY